MKELKFMHITKTGGSSILYSAEVRGIKWGRLDPLILDNKYLKNNVDHASIKYLINKELYENIKNQYDWFVVIRNPYERMISLVNWYKTYDPRFENFDKKELLEILLNIDDFGTLPASEYVYDKNEKITKHILHFENLEVEFNQLMKEYNLNIPLLKDINVSHKYMNIQDLDNKFIKKINEKYKSDFINFRYKMFDIQD